MSEKKEIVISIKPVEIDYELIFSDEKSFNEWRSIMLNAYIMYLTGGKYDIAESFKDMITDLELARELRISESKKKSDEVT